MTVLKVSFKESTLLRKRRCFPKLWEIFPLKSFQAWNCCLHCHISQLRRTLCSTVFQNAKSLVWPQVVRPFRSAPGSNEGCWQMWISSYELVQQCFPMMWRDVDCSSSQCSGLFFSLKNSDVGWYRYMDRCGIYTETEKCSERYWDICAKKVKSDNSFSNLPLMEMGFSLVVIKSTLIAFVLLIFGQKLDLPYHLCRPSYYCHLVSSAKFMMLLLSYLATLSCVNRLHSTETWLRQQPCVIPVLRTKVDEWVLLTLAVWGLPVRKLNGQLQIKFLRQRPLLCLSFNTHSESYCTT